MDTFLHGMMSTFALATLLSQTSCFFSRYGFNFTTKHSQPEMSESIGTLWQCLGPVSFKCDRTGVDA